MSLLLAALLAAQPAPTKTLSAAEIIDAAPKSSWVEIPADRLMVMTLDGGRRVVIELAPDFAPVHVANLRALARGGYWRGARVYRVQDNFVAQWGIDEDQRALPPGAVELPPAEYERPAQGLAITRLEQPDAYAPLVGFADGWPLSVRDGKAALAHCYGTVGVARNPAPDTGTGGELYAIIGQPPRRLDRNLAVVGRVIEGIEHLSALPRGPMADRGSYGTSVKPVPVTSIAIASDLPVPPRFERFDTASAPFAAYLNKKTADTNDFYRVPAGGVDICSAPVPVRAVAAK